MNSNEEGECRWSQLASRLGCGNGPQAEEMAIHLVTGLINATLRVAWRGSEAEAITEESQVTSPCDGALDWRGGDAEILVARWGCQKFASHMPVPHRMLNIVTSQPPCSRTDRPGLPCVTVLPQLRRTNGWPTMLFFEMTNFWSLPYIGPDK